MSCEDVEPEMEHEPPVVTGTVLHLLTRLVEGQEALEARFDALERALKARGSL